jgi:type II secretory pathway component PulF
MSNPYAEPTSRLIAGQDETSPSAGERWLLAGLVGGFLAATITTIAGVFVFPGFSNVFANYDADLPLMTRVVLHYYLLIWALPFALIGIKRFLPSTRRRNIALGIIGIGSSIAVVPIMVIAMYLPIFRMAATI